MTTIQPQSDPNTFCGGCLNHSPQPLMSLHTIRKGFNIPLHGGLESTEIRDAPSVQQVAALPQEAHGIKVKMLVQEGDAVKVGTPLFCDKRDPNVLFTSPGAGTVSAVNRGFRRMALSVVVDLDGDAHENWGTLTWDHPETIANNLQRSGLWTLLRQRPFDKVAESTAHPSSLFVTATDTHPLAPPPLAVLADREDKFKSGLEVLSRLAPKTFLCTGKGEDWANLITDGVEHHQFSGAHPAGNAGVHINALDPVGQNKLAWNIGYQEVTEIGHLVQTGQLPMTRVIAAVGPAMNQPALIRVRRGTSTTKLIQAHNITEKVRVLSGSALSGDLANPDSPTGFLGSRANQMCVLSDAPEKEFIGWANPIGTRHTFTHTALGKFFRKEHKYDTDLNGSHRAIVPLGSWEEVMPMDIMPTQLIKALAAGDLEMCEKLGVLEVTEEDLALCEYLDQSKTAITSLLRAMLTQIEKEG